MIHTHQLMDLSDKQNILLSKLDEYCKDLSDNKIKIMFIYLKENKNQL